MDTRFWGPSGWQLFHLVTINAPPNAVRHVMDDMPNVLPCKFCRASTAEFVAAHPPTKPYAKWLYEIHNKVNDKLRRQCADDEAVICPDPDPTFEEVKAMYSAMKPTAVPGRDFLMAVAYNFPATPDPRDMSTQREFLHHLADAYPFDEFRSVVQSYIKAREPVLTSQKTYTKWMYGLMKELSATAKTPIKTYRGYMAHLAYYKSGCTRKTYKGKTCRRVVGGGYTKNRDPRITRRVSRKGLLG